MKNLSETLHRTTKVQHLSRVQVSISRSENWGTVVKLSIFANSSREVTCLLLIDQACSYYEYEANEEVAYKIDRIPTANMKLKQFLINDNDLPH